MSERHRSVRPQGERVVVCGPSGRESRR
jgi:hypothetical protein